MPTKFDFDFLVQSSSWKQSFRPRHISTYSTVMTVRVAEPRREGMDVTHMASSCQITGLLNSVQGTILMFSCASYSNTQHIRSRFPSLCFHYIRSSKAEVVRYVTLLSR